MDNDSIYILTSKCKEEKNILVQKLKTYNSNYKIIYKYKNEVFEKIKNLKREKDKREINQLYNKLDVYEENIRSIRIKRNEIREKLWDITFEYLINCTFSKKEDIIKYFNEFINKNEEFSKSKFMFRVFHLSFNHDNPIPIAGKIYKLISIFDDKFKDEFDGNLAKFFKNMFLGMGKSGIFIKNKDEYQEMEKNFKKSFGIEPPLKIEVLKAICNDTKALWRLKEDRSQYLNLLSAHLVWLLIVFFLLI